MINVVILELEKKALEQVLQEIENQIRAGAGRSDNQSIMRSETLADLIMKQDDRLKSGWPPSKYKNIKGSGYGTTWSSNTLKKSSTGGLDKNKSIRRQVDRNGSRSPVKFAVQEREDDTFGYSKEDIDTHNYIIRLKSNAFEGDSTGC